MKKWLRSPTSYVSNDCLARGDIYIFGHKYGAAERYEKLTEIRYFVVVLIGVIPLCSAKYMYITV